MWEEIPALKSELELFEAALLGEFSQKKNIQAYLNGLSLGIIQSGGKRLRPAMVVAAAMLGNYDRERVLPAALSIELLHTATLVHDDIIDDAQLRRGKPTVYAREGVNQAVFAGDYLYVKSILTLASAGLPIERLQESARAVEAICVGEVEQFRNRGALSGFKTYLSRITRKTAVLFAASCALGAHIGGLPEELVKKAARFGGYYGIAFQIKDDLLDMLENPKSIGKPVGSDLKEGIATLPVILAAAKDPEAQRHIEAFLKTYGKKRHSAREIAQIVGYTQKAGGIEETETILQKYIAKAGKALDRLPDAPGRDMLRHILEVSFK